jgi:di/tricarboxylate transporter
MNVLQDIGLQANGMVIRIEPMMTFQIWMIFIILGLTLVLFITEWVRFDLVALLALLAVTFTGLIPYHRVFSGFSNSAVITVAAVLVLSRGLQNSGLVESIGEQLAKAKGGKLIQIGLLTGLVAMLSTFMNNVGSVALLLPVALYIARKKEIPASILLMPLAFAAHFGGMITLIGTPTNLIVSSFREQTLGIPFKMFDFAPVGIGITIASLFFIVFIGWRMIPTRKGQKSVRDLFEIQDYVTEVELTEDSKLVGERLSEIKKYTENGVNILGLVRNQEKRMAPGPQTKFKVGDILIVQCGTKELDDLVSNGNLSLVGSKAIEREDLVTDEMTLIEAVITASSPLVNNSAFSLDLRRRYGVNLLAIFRKGSQLRARLDRIRLKEGDVLLLQGHPQTTSEALKALACLPLAERDLRIGKPKNIILSLVIFLIAVLLAAFNIFSVSVAFVAGAVAMVLAKQVSLREAYESINWPILILLGAMIPVGEALETTGGAQLIADFILRFSAELAPALIVAIVMIVTMFLSDLVNNTAAVVLMAPIGISLAQSLGGSVDTLLMGIVIASSCAFLTPIGHQSNTLVMGPGGYKFGDYWRMGLLIELIVVLVGVPLIMVFWPFGV